MDAPSMLTPKERNTLLRLARVAIADAFCADGALERLRLDVELTEALLEIRGAFVTLMGSDPGQGHAEPTLRGCIGTLLPHDPLFECVIHNALQAAFHDPRFPRLEVSDLASLSISISALSPARPVDGPEAIVPGRHGVVLGNGPFKSVFLPQVAEEQGWDTVSLLDHLALKAGLKRDGWKDARLSVFEAEVFGEDTTDPRDS